MGSRPEDLLFYPSGGRKENIRTFVTDNGQNSLETYQNRAFFESSIGNWWNESHNSRLDYNFLGTYKNRDFYRKYLLTTIQVSVKFYRLF